MHARVRDYETQVNRDLAARAAEIEDFVAAHRARSRRDFAALAQRHFDKRLTGAVLKTLDGQPAWDVMIDVLRKAARSDSKVDAVSDLFGFAWTREGINLPEPG